FVRQKFEGGRLVYTLKPSYVRLADVSFRGVDAASETVTGCALRIIVLETRQLGPGWQYCPRDGLSLARSGSNYRLAGPLGSLQDSLLVETAIEGTAATIASENAACPLQGAPDVTAAEMRSLSVSRTLQPSGPVLIAMVSA